MELKKITLQGWQSFKDLTEVKINKGLCLIKGVNRDNEKAVSNRSGKTSLVNAMSFALYGKTPLVARSNNLLNTSSKYGYVELAFKGMTINRYIHHPEYGYGISLNGELITQDDVDRKFGIDFQAFVASVFFGTNYSDFLEKILRKPVEAKDILTAMIPKLKLFDLAWEVTKDRQGTLEKEHSSLSLSKSSLEGKLCGYREQDFSKAIEKFEEDRKSKISQCLSIIHGMENRFTQEFVGLTDLEKKLKEGQVILAESKKLDSYISNLHTDIARQKTSSNFISSTINGLQKELAGLSKGMKDRICPTCGQTIKDKSGVEKTKKELEKKITDQNKLLDEVSTKIMKLEESENEFILEHSEMAPAVHEAEGLATKVVQAKSMLKEIQIKKDELERIKTAIDPYLESEKKQKESIAQIKKELEEIDQKLTRIDNDKRHWEFLYKAFGPRGIKNFVFDEVVHKLTDYSKKYLDFLTEGTIKIQFDPRKEKKSGGYIDNIGLEVFNQYGSRDYFTWSKSERGKISLSVDLAMNELLDELFGNPFGFLVFDEAFDGLDSVGVESFCQLLRRYRTKVNTIFVISHSPDIDDFFDWTITVEKENGISKII